MAYLLRLLINLFRTLFLPFWLFRRWSWSRGEPRWISLDIKPRVVPFRGGGGSALARLTESAREQSTTSLEGVRELIEKAGRDPMIRGLILSLPPLEAGWATCKGLRELVTQLRAAGKQVVCHLPQGGGNQELYVALAADRIYMAPYASLGPLGLAITPLYFRPLLDRLGIRVQAQASGEYKSAAEPGLRETMSDAAREQLDALMAVKHAALVNALRQARGLSENETQELFAQSLILADDALARRVVDGVKYEDELPEALNENAKAVSPLPAARYLRVKRPLWIPLSRPASVAVVPLHGMISGESPSGLGAGLRHSTLAPLLRGLAKNPKVSAIVLHIDSRGGSALASELMHREIKQLALKKPVVACFGEIAASGGYYLACACNKIVAQDLCTTGSIGVVTAKVDAQDFIARIGVRPQFLRTAQSADMFSSARALSGHEEGLMHTHIAALYKRFLAVAAEGRGRSPEAIDSVARGRVWSGADAKEHGLIDAIGGVERALEEARALVPELTQAERAALQPQLYRVKSGRRLGLPALLGAWTENSFLRELVALYELQREAALYYAPLD